jgi:hypothetical protein
LQVHAEKLADPSDCRLRIFENFTVCQAKNAEALRGQPLIARNVSLAALGCLV